jgi:hypothetical protein
MSREQMIKDVVAVLTASAEDDGYDYDTVDAKREVTRFFAIADSKSSDEIAEYIDDKGLI